MRHLTEVEPGILVATAELYTTTSTVVVGPDGGCLVVDPAVTVAEITGLAAELAGRGLRPLAGWSTHPHWDHVLWCAELGDVPRYATAPAAATAHRERDELIRGVTSSAPGHDLELLGLLTPCDSGAIPWDGPLAQVIEHDAHEYGHGAVFVPDTGTLLAGDMLSDIEIPLLYDTSADPVGQYLAGLERLAAVPAVRAVVPGHGHAGDAAEFRRRVDADRRYLDALARGDAAAGQDQRIGTGWLRAEHDRQVRMLHR
jgi:hydroxyacylglutathione hydrolase